MIELQDMVVRYGSGRNAVTAVDGVSLSLARGETLGLVGESGCGKSTVARAIAGLLPIASGRIVLDGVDYSSMSSRNSPEYRRLVQMVFQDPYSSLNPRMTIGRAMGEAITLRGVSGRSERRSVALQALELVELSETALDRYPHQFSGGQRQRIAIARALAVGPQVIIADEITSALDVSIQATILNLLRTIRRETGVSIVFISHDLSVIRYVSDSVAVMYLGEIVERAETASLFVSPRHPYSIALIRSIPQLGEERQAAPVKGELPDPRNPPTGCRFHLRCFMGPTRFPERVICREESPQSIAATEPHWAACHFAELVPRLEQAESAAST
jgi:peptide/nickel transport system ATP-binding protein